MERASSSTWVRTGTPALGDRNLIGGNGRWGVRVNHGETSQNRIQNNIVGLNPLGATDLGHASGIDIQWWTWGNLIGGDGSNEHNVVSGNGVGIDLSHKATGNLVVGNRLGTKLNGRSANAASRNGVNVILKDDAEGNYVGANVMAGAGGDYAIVHKVNYTGGNTFVDNRIGVSVNGSDIGNEKGGMLLRGHDDVYHGNIFANIGGSRVIHVSNTSDRGPGSFEPDEQTVRNSVRRGTYYGNGGAPIRFDADDCCPHPSADTPSMTGIGPGQVSGASTCARCEVEVYVSGSVNGDGTLSPGTGTTGFTWIGTVQADGRGRWSMASPLLTVGSRARVASLSASGAVSTFSRAKTIPAQGTGLVDDPQQPFTPLAPPRPADPPIYQPATFSCSVAGGVLSWDDAGAPEYYVFAVDGGVERYLGGHSATRLAVVGADSYRVEHWITGQATNATCDGPGGADPFSCSVNDGVLRWDDAGAPEYYVFAVDGGVERYLGGHSTTSLVVPAAQAYRVEHWVTGQATNALCSP